MAEKHEEVEDVEAMKDDHYRAERVMLIQGEADAAMRLDKTMITLSAGALILSITFIHDIAPNPTLVELLFIAWGLFIISLLSIVVSLITSKSAFKNAQDNLAESYRQQAIEISYSSKANTWTGICNWISVGAFVAGLILLTVFAVGNILC